MSGLIRFKINANKAVTSQNKISDKTKDAEDKCTEIGFKKVPKNMVIVFLN